MASIEVTGTKGAISYALRILRDSLKDLWPLLRDDGPFYVPAAVIMFAISYIMINPGQNFALHPREQSLSTYVTIGVAFLVGYLLSLSWGGVAATRTAKQFGVLSTPRLRAFKQYCFIGIIVDVYGLIAIFVAAVIGSVIVIAVVIAAWIIGLITHWSPDLASWPRPSHAVTNVLFDILFVIAATMFNAKIGAAAAIRILSDKPRPIATSWSLTNRFWRQSFVLAGATTILTYLPGWILPTKLVLTLSATLLSLPYSFLAMTLVARMFVQFAREMLDAPEPSSVEVPTP